MRLVGILVFAATLFLPVHSCGPGPFPRAAPPSPAAHRATQPRAEDVQVPIEEIVRHGGEGFTEGGAWKAVWRVREWYPYLLLPFWLVALALAASSGRLERAAGWGCLALTLALAVFETIYVTRTYVGFLPQSARAFEVGFVCLVVVAVLFLRRHRSLLDPAATVSAQALLAFLHGLTFPGHDVRVWVDDGASLSGILGSLLHDYRPAFWLALAGLLVAAVPAYLRASPHRPVPSVARLDAPRAPS